MMLAGHIPQSSATPTCVSNLACCILQFLIFGCRKTFERGFKDAAVMTLFLTLLLVDRPEAEPSDGTVENTNFDHRSGSVGHGVNRECHHPNNSNASGGDIVHHSDENRPHYGHAAAEYPAHTNGYNSTANAAGEVLHCFIQ